MYNVDDGPTLIYSDEPNLSDAVYDADSGRMVGHASTSARSDLERVARANASMIVPGQVVNRPRQRRPMQRPMQQQQPAQQPQQQAQQPTADAPKMWTLRHLDEVRQVGEADMVALAQKGLDYDRIRAKYDALRAKQPEQDSGLSDQEPAGRTPAEGEEQPPDPRPAEGGDQPPYRPGDAAGEALRRQSYMRFSQEFPGIKPEEIPAEIWRDFAAGRGDLADLFARHENRQLKAQLAVARQNEENRRRSTGSRATAGSTVQSRLDADWYDGT